jgi:hypothetical protein
MVFDPQSKVVMIGHEGARVGYEMHHINNRTTRQDVTALVSPLYTQFPDVLEAEPFWEYIAFQTPDGITYGEDTIYVSLYNAPYMGALYNRVAAALGENEADRIPRDYAIKCGLKTQTYRIKVYDRDILNHQLPGLPRGARYSAGSGISYHVDAPNIKDMYFLHRNPVAVASFYGHSMPTHPDLDDVDTEHFKGFAVTFDAATLSVLKMKRYFFPQDPLMLDFQDR